MVQLFVYEHATTPAGPGTSYDVPDIQILSEHRWQAAAALGEASVVGVTVDDPEGVWDFRGLWTWKVYDDEMAADDDQAWMGYVGVQKISRGADSDTLFPIGAGRRWELELAELSAIAGFRVITGDDGYRPEETVDDRLAWLIGTAVAYLPVADNGLIASDTTMLDANDYRGQFAKPVLDDMALKTGFNWWVYYEPGTAVGTPISLAFFHPDSDLYTSDIKISNSPGEADGTAILWPYETAVLTRDPEKIAAGVWLPYAGTATATGGTATPAVSAVYEIDYDTSYEFAFRDQVAPTASVKTEARALELADRLLADNNEQDETATIGVRMQASLLNSIRHGQRLQVQMVHWPGWEDYRWCRVTRKTFGPPVNRTQMYYDVELELSPIRARPSGAFGRGGDSADFSVSIPILPRETTPGNLLIVAVAGLGGPGLYPSAPRFQNDPDTGAPPIAPIIGLDGWTILDTAGTDFGGMNIGGPCSGYDPVGAPCTKGIAVAIAYRFVDVAEVTTHPVAISWEDGHDTTGAWLWEIPTDQAPGTATISDNAHEGSNPATATLDSLDGNVLAIIAWMLFNDNKVPYDSEAVNGTGVQLVEMQNTRVLAPGTTPWVQVIQLRSGGAVAGSIAATLNSSNNYTSLNWCGVAIQLPSVAGALPTIPYPANQVG